MNFAVFFIVVWTAFWSLVAHNWDETKSTCRFLAYEYETQYRIVSRAVIFEDCEIRVDGEWVDGYEADKLNWENR